MIWHGDERRRRRENHPPPSTSPTPSVSRTHQIEWKNDTEEEAGEGDRHLVMLQHPRKEREEDRRATFFLTQEDEEEEEKKMKKEVEAINASSCAAAGGATMGLNKASLALSFSHSPLLSSFLFLLLFLLHAEAFSRIPEGNFA